MWASSISIACCGQTLTKQSQHFTMTSRKWTQDKINDVFRLLSTGSLQWLSDVLADGFPVNATRGDVLPGGTLLHSLACMKNTAVLVKTIVDAGANVTLLNRWQETAGHVAARYRNLDVLQALGPGCVGVTNTLGNTLLHSAVQHMGPSQETVAWLLQQPELPLFARNNDGYTALDWCHRYHVSIHAASATMIEQEMQRRVRWTVLRAVWVAAAVAGRM
jgi:hypothetical protein